MDHTNLRNEEETGPDDRDINFSTFCYTTNKNKQEQQYSANTTRATRSWLHADGTSS